MLLAPGSPNERVAMDSSERSIVPRRVAGVTVVLAGTGALLGAGFAAGAAAVTGLALRAASVVTSGASIALSAGLGALVGGVLTPMTALSLLRQVALGKALLLTLIGMAIGLSAGQVVNGTLPAVAGGAAGGFLLVALLLRLTAGRKPAAPR